MKFKVIKEYPKFYLTEAPNGYRECFSNYEYKIDKDGYIIKRKDLLYENGEIILQRKKEFIEKLKGKV